MLLPNYPCSQQELYTICDEGWDSCELLITDFTAFKPKYIDVFIAARRAEIVTARQFPDEQARNEASETAHIKLGKQNTVCLNLWQILKRYIIDAFEKDFQKTNLDAAGQGYYADAANENWDTTEGLLSSAQKFITDHLAELTANDNMPAGFPLQFTTAATDFSAKHKSFLQAEKGGVQQTEDKIKANNLIYTALINMCLDGQEIYKNDDAKQKRFIIAELIYYASGTGTAGIKGTVTNELTGEPLPDTKVSIEGTNLSTVTDADGKYAINQMAAGDYTILFHHDAFIEKTVPQKITVGTVSTINISLQSV